MAQTSEYLEPKSEQVEQNRVSSRLRTKALSPLKSRPQIQSNTTENKSMAKDKHMISPTPALKSTSMKLRPIPKQAQFQSIEHQDH